jgi:hypothetical protein
MCTIGGIMEVSSIRISFKNKDRWYHLSSSSRRRFAIFVLDWFLAKASSSSIIDEIRSFSFF